MGSQTVDQSFLWEKSIKSRIQLISMNEQKLKHYTIYMIFMYYICYVYMKQKILLFNK